MNTSRGLVMKNLRRLSKSIALLLIPTVLTFAQQPAIEKCNCPPPQAPVTAVTQTATNTPGPFGHPHPQMRPSPSTMTTIGNTSYVLTGQSLFPESDPFKYPPGTNFLPTIYTNMFDGFGKEMPNTLPSTPSNPYNLHDGDPVVTPVNETSPTDDLRTVFQGVTRLSAKPQKEAAEVEAIRRNIQLGI